MRGPWMMVVASLVLGGVIGVATGAETAAAGQPGVTLRAVTAWPEHVTDNAGFFHLRDQLSRRSNGRLRIDYVGGPEAIPTFEQIEALRIGVVDIAWLSASYTVSIVPEANFFRLSQLDPGAERQKGVYDAFNRVFQQKANAVYLGRGIPLVPFHLYLVKPVSRVQDFRGLRIRVTPNYLEFVRALGAAPISTPPTEVYSALERGVVDGFGWPAFGIGDWKWDELVKYRVDPGFYQVDTIGLINRETWLRLSPDLREVVTAAALDMESAMVGYFRGVQEREADQLRASGVQIRRLPDPEAKAYLDLAYDVMWKRLLEEMPQTGREFEALLRR